MLRRLTKPTPSCKALVGALAVFAGSVVLGDTASKLLRDCVTRAGSAAAISTCEQQHQSRLKQSIRRLTAAIRARLDRHQRQIFDRSAEAWRNFLNRESVMVNLSLGQRTDGLGPKLAQGSITRLYEQREQQLREHLHNLSLPPLDGGEKSD